MRLNCEGPGFWPGLLYFYFNCTGLEITPTQWGCLLFCYGYAVLGLDMEFCWEIQGLDHLDRFGFFGMAWMLILC
jgi:hypothetical protein